MSIDELMKGVAPPVSGEELKRWRAFYTGSDIRSLIDKWLEEKGLLSVENRFDPKWYEELRQEALVGNKIEPFLMLEYIEYRNVVKVEMLQAGSEDHWYDTIWRIPEQRSEFLKMALFLKH